MTRLLLVRHGEVAGIDPPTFRGRAELALTGRGEKQAALTRDAIHSRWPVDAIYCSPLGRCVRTANTLGEAFGLQAMPEADLTDIDYGEWTGLSRDEVDRRWPQDLAMWKSTPHAFHVPGGESLQAVAARAVDALIAILSTPRTSVAIVTHDSVIRVLLCHAMGLPLASYWLLAPSPCGISVATYAEGRFTVEAFNETAHLSGA
ncbi:MAG TPA: histidine phosphatase family protein [Luteibacter sp.]|jgi:broad specificity phosphatase PhoE|nr:histidine phosphatase family protein [Luteibacter sp.]